MIAMMPYKKWEVCIFLPFFAAKLSDIFHTSGGGVVNKVWKNSNFFFEGFLKDMDEAFTYLDEAIF